MENKKVNLHADSKRILVLIVFTTAVLTLLTIVAAVAENDDSAQLAAIIRSNYEYSAVANNAVDQDNYYQFNAGISFMTEADAETSINADIVMQSENVDYTKNVYWNAGRLGRKEIAITRNIARSEKLKIGDALFSKNVVNGKVYEYTIREIIPEISTVRRGDDISSFSGVIIAGYDNEYISNINHTNLMFTNETIDGLSQEISETPSKLLYRNEEIANICKTLLPMTLLFVILQSTGVAILGLLLNNNVESNFHRFIILGYNKIDLDMTYRYFMMGIGLIPILVNLIFALIFIAIWKLNPCGIFIVGITFLLEAMTLFISEAMLNRRLWRK